MDQIWQFGPENVSVDVATIGDEYSVYINDAPNSKRSVASTLKQ